MKKKKKERTEKVKSELLKKQILAEERQQKLAELQKTILALSQTSKKKVPTYLKSNSQLIDIDQ